MTSRLFSWYVALAERRAGWLALGLGVITALALSQAVRLGLNTDMAELLPNDHPGVVAYRKLSGRQNTSSNLALLVSSTDPEAARRFARDVLAPALGRIVPRVFSEAQWQPDNEQPDYARRWRWLYADLADLEAAESLLDRVISGRTGLMVDLEGDPEAELKSLRERLEKRLPAPSRPTFEMDEDGRHWVGVVLWRRGGGFATLGDVEALREARELVASLRPASYHPDLTVDFTGQIGLSVDEADAVRDDLTVATAVCGSLVLLVIFLYFRRVALIWVIGSPAVMGLLLALALARHTIHELNANTAFLISIILGNGINVPIILLARYGEERRKGRAVGASLADAMSSTVLATATAMLAASMAYGALLVTSLRGFNQFGLVGGAGMLLAWICTFVLVPPLVFLGERLRPGSLTPRPPSILWRRPFEWLGTLVERHPRAPALVALVIALAAAVPLGSWLRDPYEWDFSKLRTSDTTAAKRWERMHHIGIGQMVVSYIATDGILMVDKPEQADPVAEEMRRKDKLLGDRNLIRTVRTLSTVLPQDQERKLEVLARIRAKIDRHRDVMSDAEAREAREWRPPEYLRVVTADDLPSRIRAAFTEVDGVRGRMVGIDAEFTHMNGNSGHDLLRLARAIEVELFGKRWVPASAATVFAGMIEVILKDGPRVTLIALIGVTLLVLLSFGLRGAMPVLASVGIGLVWLGGLVALFGMRLNFLNFVALPITLGVGADYGANIWARLRAGTSGTRESIVETGSAVALCSATTIIGYSSLLLAHNGALRSFGMIANLGEITCLVAALLIVPAMASFARRSPPQA